MVAAKIYERSSKLRQIAIAHFQKDGEIFCRVCNFNYNHFYGEKIGRGYIEIHHLKPIFKYQSEELDKTIEQALTNVAPVCSNCHRMIHRDWRNPIHIDDLIEQIKANGVFSRLKETG